MYGDKDWMDVGSSKNLVNQIIENNPNTNLEKVVTIKGAGHSIMFDAPLDFNKLLFKYYKKFTTKDNEFDNQAIEIQTYEFLMCLSEISYTCKYQKADLSKAPDNLGLNKMLSKKQTPVEEEKEVIRDKRTLMWFGVDRKHNDDGRKDNIEDEVFSYDTMVPLFCEYDNTEFDSVLGIDPLIFFEEMNTIGKF